MIDLMGVELPKGKAILLTAEIGAALSDLSNPALTVVYTDTFPEGLTVKMNITEFFDLWQSCLLDDLETVDVEVNEDAE